MNEYLWQYVRMVDPFATKEEVAELKELNEWDLLIVFHSGKKVVLDRYTGYHKDVFYNSVNELTEEQEKKEFAYRLRSLMNRKWITQEQLAEQINTSQVMISRYVRGETIPSAIILRKIAKALDCSMDDFFYQEY
jgi:DNA-binding XRE family transcriptional regulator